MFYLQKMEKLHLVGPKMASLGHFAQSCKSRPRLQITGCFDEVESSKLDSA